MCWRLYYQTCLRIFYDFFIKSVLSTQPLRIVTRRYKIQSVIIGFVNNSSIHQQQWRTLALEWLNAPFRVHIVFCILCPNEINWRDTESVNKKITLKKYNWTNRFLIASCKFLLHKNDLILHYPDLKLIEIIFFWFIWLDLFLLLSLSLWTCNVLCILHRILKSNTQHSLT